MKLSTKSKILAELCRQHSMSPNMTVHQVSEILNSIKARSVADAEIKIAAAFGF